MITASEVAQQLLQIKAIKLSPQNPFTWASGIKSPIYCDNRKVLSYPATRNIIKQSLVEQSEQFGAFDVIAGVATAGIPHGALLADALGLPFVYVRSKAKGHGMKNLIEGELKEGASVLVVEDLISTGGSCLKAVDALKAVNATISGVLAIFTYGFDAAIQNFKAADVPFATLSDYDTLVQFALETNYIESDMLKTLQEWRKSPQTWKV